MSWRSIAFDWNQAKAFLATAEEGSLSAAARKLGLTQPTLGRQVSALEAELGVILFERIGRSLSLTESGLELLDHVRAMGDAAGLVSLAASGRSQLIEGQVCITATDAMSIYHLPAILERLRELAPEIEVEVLASNSIRDLRRREADIAIRHVRPDQPDLITRLVYETKAHMYASSAYLDNHGRPSSVDELASAAFIGYENRDRMIAYLNAFGLSLDRRNFKLSSNSGLAGWELVKQGLGIGVMARDLADITPGIEVVLPDVVAIDIPVWLTTHRELHLSRRIRLVYDLLAESLSKGIAPSHR